MTAKLNGTEDNHETLIVMAEGNPGALTALTMMFGAAVDHLEQLQIIYNADDMNLRGPALWVAFSDWAQRDVRKCIDGILSRDPDMIEAVNASGEAAEEVKP